MKKRHSVEEGKSVSDSARRLGDDEVALDTPQQVSETRRSGRSGGRAFVSDFYQPVMRHHMGLRMELVLDCDYLVLHGPLALRQLLVPRSASRRCLPPSLEARSTLADPGKDA